MDIILLISALSSKYINIYYNHVLHTLGTHIMIYVFQVHSVAQLIVIFCFRVLRSTRDGNDERSNLEFD